MLTWKRIWKLYNYGNLLHIRRTNVAKVNGIMTTIIRTPHLLPLHYPLIKGYHTGCPLMAGHNKWSKIKRPKAAADFERSVQIGKVCIEIRTAVRLGGEDPNTNLRLAGVISRARNIDIPKSTIENAIASALAQQQAHNSAGGSVPLVLYEARSNGGYSILIEVNNLKRTKNELQRILKQYKAVMVDSKTILFQFDHKGIVSISKNSLFATVDENDDTDVDVLEIAIEIGAEDVKNTEDFNDDDSDFIEFICDPKELQTVTTAANENGLEVIQSSLVYIPNTWASLSKEASERAKSGLVTSLKEHPDVVNVYTNIKT